MYMDIDDLIGEYQNLADIGDAIAGLHEWKLEDAPEETRKAFERACLEAANAVDNVATFLFHYQGE